jgi:hypothetical protein
MNILDIDGFVSLYSLLVGISIFGYWAALYTRKQVFAATSRPAIETKYHVVAELLTAAILVVGGIGTILSAEWSGSVLFIGLGMLLYTEINSPGFYAARKEKSMARMFWILTVLTGMVTSLFLISRA